MKVHELASNLCGMKEFHEGDISIERYMTPIKAAARVALTTESRYEGLQKGIMCDVGCRTGILSIACSYLDAPFIVVVDIGERAIQCARQSTDACSLHSVDFVLAHGLEADFPRVDLVYTVVMNLLFGAKRTGANTDFIARRVHLAGTVLYLMHKMLASENIEMEDRK